MSRNDPAGATLSPDAKVRVSLGIKGQKPFYSTDVSLKPGGSLSVSAPYSGGTSDITLTMTAFALDLKELSPADNSRDHRPASIAVI